MLDRIHEKVKITINKQHLRAFKSDRIRDRVEIALKKQVYISKMFCPENSIMLVFPLVFAYIFFSGLPLNLKKVTPSQLIH